MGNKYLDTTFVDKAIHFAVDVHANTERRGKGFPYVIHVLEAMEIVATMSNNQNLLAAAALHDTVEDTDVTLEQIRQEFGDTVAYLVECETDKGAFGRLETATWRERKHLAIERIAHASREAKIVAMGDKLSNMRAIARDYHRIGDELWKIFHAPNGKPDHEWHYRGLAMALSDLSGTEAFTEFTRLIDDVFGQPKPELIDMNDYELSGGGFYASSYNHKDGNRMMKLYELNVPFDDVLRELQVSWSIAEMGIKIPKAYRLVTDGTRVGVEFERITNKRSFARAISDEPEHLEMYATRFAEKCLELHATKCNENMFSSVSQYFTNVVNTSSYSDVDKQKMLAFINSVPEQTTCIHGDLHIGNIITTGLADYWIDLADFRYGNPLFDMGMFYMISHVLPAEMVLDLYHITKEQMELVWSVFVKTYCGINTPIQPFENQCAKVASLCMISFVTKQIDKPGMKEFIQKNLLS